VSDARVACVVDVVHAPPRGACGIRLIVVVIAGGTSGVRGAGASASICNLKLYYNNPSKLDRLLSNGHQYFSM
jgi:hypothetical protein